MSERRRSDWEVPRLTRRERNILLAITALAVSLFLIGDILMKSLTPVLSP